MLTITDLSKTYRGKIALHATSLTFEPGALTALVGPRGAGKTTLLSCLSMKADLSSGHMEADGLGRSDTDAGREAIRALTGAIPQHWHLSPAQTAVGNVINGCGCSASPRRALPWSREETAQALAALRRVGQLESALKKAGELSPRGQMLVLLACALAKEPRILLADDPVRGLDEDDASGVLGQLARLCREDGLCAVASLSDSSLAERHADRVIVMEDGRVVRDYAPAGAAAAARDGGAGTDEPPSEPPHVPGLAV